MQQGKFEEAEAALNEALEKDPACADALINMIALAQQTGKAPEVNNVLKCTGAHHKRAISAVSF